MSVPWSGDSINEDGRRKKKHQKVEQADLTFDKLTIIDIGIDNPLKAVPQGRFSLGVRTLDELLQWT